MIAAAGNHPGGDGAGGGFCDPAGEGCEGIKTLSTQKVAAAQTKAYSKNNTEDKVAILTARNTMEEGTQDIELHARGTACLHAQSKPVKELYCLKDVIDVAFWQRPARCRSSKSVRISR